jgi:hypothetical protein
VVVGAIVAGTEGDEPWVKAVTDSPAFIAAADKCEKRGSYMEVDSDSRTRTVKYHCLP